jgi:branched-chain amino acid transport system permease protein
MSLLKRIWAGDWSRATIVCIGVTLLLYGMPYLVNEFALHVLAISCYYLILAASWNLLAGYTGRFSLAQQTFATVGAYTTGLLIHYWGVPIWFGILSAALVSTLTGLALGALVLRMQAGYLAVATWSFAATVQIVITAAYEITRGQLGLAVPSLLGHLEPIAYYYVFLTLASVCVLAMYFIVHSPVGQFMRAIKDDELRAATLGVDTTRWKVAVFAVTSLFSGLAGAFYAHYILVLSPAIADFNEMGKVLAMVIVGGLGSFLGPLIGAPLVQIVLTYFQSYGSWSIVGYALVVIVVMRLYRGGIAALIEAGVQRLRAALDGLRSRRGPTGGRDGAGTGVVGTAGRR